GIFLVLSARIHADEGLCIMEGPHTRWSKLVPIKVNILAWRIQLNKLPTRHNMSLRGLDIPSISCLVVTTSDYACDGVISPSTLGISSIDLVVTSSLRACDCVTLPEIKVFKQFLKTKFIVKDLEFRLLTGKASFIPLQPIDESHALRDDVTTKSTEEIPKVDGEVTPSQA
nr:reverse transcriptase domain, reverse transcriptase zinc-binding domain protein [Tanacetum cinerariifolium]